MQETPAGDEKSEATRAEQAECGQVRDLCEQAQRREQEFEAAKARVEGDASVENIDRYRTAFLVSETALSKLRKAAMDSAHAHGYVLACFQQCPVLKEFFKRANGHRPSG